MKESTQNTLLLVGAAALVVYFISKQKDDGFELPGIPNINIAPIQDLQIPDLGIPGGGGLSLIGGFPEFQGCPGLTMPDLSGFDLGLPDFNLPDFNLPTMPGLPDLPGLPGLPGIDGDGESWLQRLWDRMFALPDTTIEQGILETRHGTYEWHPLTFPYVTPAEHIKSALLAGIGPIGWIIQSFRHGSPILSIERISEPATAPSADCPGGVCPTERLGFTPFFLPGPVGAAPLGTGSSRERSGAGAAAAAPSVPETPRQVPAIPEKHLLAI